jgi:hypothetical protein
MPDPNILYSTTTYLAFKIAQTYYGDVHYVWCTHIFDGSKHKALDPGVPPTSSPWEIYKGFREEVSRKDRHSAKVQDNRAGILRGASVKLQAKVIEAQAQEEIQAIVEEADLSYFEPIILVIPFVAVRTLIQPVPIRQRASLFSSEVIIPALPRSTFDVIQP